MTNAYYTSPVDVAPDTRVRSVDLNTVDAAIDTAFDKLPTEANLKQGTINYAVDTGGVANVYLVALPHAPASYVDGLEVTMRPTRTNGGACTVNVNGLGPKAVKRIDGTDPAASDIVIDGPVTLRYNSNTGVFYLPPVVNSQLVAAAASASAANASAGAAAGSASAASSSAGASNTSAGAANTSAGTAATQATLAQDWATKASGEVAVGQGFSAKKYAQDAAASAASIASGPVASINGLTGVVTGIATQAGAENQSNKTHVNPAYLENAKGNQTTGTHTFDYNSGAVGSITIGGALALAFSNWPASGKEAAFHLWVTNGGAFALTLPTINWVKPDRTTTTSFSTYLSAISVTALQTSGLNQFVIWTKDGGTTLYGKLV